MGSLSVDSLYLVKGLIRNKCSVSMHIMPNNANERIINDLITYIYLEQILSNL